MPRPSTAVRRVKGTFSLQRAPGGRPLLPGSRSAQSAPVVAERGRRGRVPSGPAAPGGGGTSTYFPNVNVPFSHPSGVRAQKDGRKVRPCDEGTFTSSTAIDTRGGSGGNPGRVGRQPGAGRATTRAGRTGGAPVVDSGSARRSAPVPGRGVCARSGHTGPSGAGPGPPVDGEAPVLRAPEARMRIDVAVRRWATARQDSRPTGDAGGPRLRPSGSPLGPRPLILQKEPAAEKGSSPGPMGWIRAASSLKSLRGRRPSPTDSAPTEG